MIGNKMSGVNEVIAELIELFRNGEIWVFAGAGISVNSGIPVVNQLVPEVLGKLGVSEKDIKIYMESRFCFEEFVQTLLECSEKEDAQLLLDLFSEGKPNTNHILLAKLVKRGYLKAIVTTNFDLLIERAIEDQGLRRGKDFEVFHREEDFEHIYWDDNKPCVFKIHGSIEDIETMAITLQQVAKQELSSQRREIIEYVFSKGKHRNVLVLGYSSSDAFDISPHIATLEGGLKRVIFIEHATSPRVENLTIRKEKNPFRQFEVSQRMYYDTDMLVKTLWSPLLKDTVYRFQRGTTLWEEHVDKWCGMTHISSLGAAGPEIAGRIFYAISEFKTAMKYFEQAAKRYALWDKEKQAALDCMLGNICIRMGDKEKAVLTYYSPAIETAKTMDFKRTLIAITSSAADVLNEYGDSNKASTYYLWAFSTALKIGDEKEATAQHAKWGNASNHLGRFLAAKFTLAKALEKADKIGDIRTKAAILGYLGDSHVGLKEYQKAISYYEQAIEADQNIGHKRGEGIHLTKAGDVFVNLGEHGNAIENFKRALKITEAIEDDEEKVILLTVLGSVHRVIGAYQEAVDEYKEALKTCTKGLEKREPWMTTKLKGDALAGLGTCYTCLGEYRNAIDAYEKGKIFISITAEEKINFGVLHMLGVLHRKLEEHEKAIYYFERALEINRKLEDREEEVDILINLGLSHSDRGAHQEANDIYEEALKIARHISDKQKEGILLINIGKAHFDLRRYSKSVESFEQALAILGPLLGDNDQYTKTAVKNLRTAKKRLSEELI